MHMIEELMILLEKKYHLICKIENIYQNGGLKDINNAFL